jgi:glycosyltransferase involved in cell wall biosynthesis
MAVVIPVFEESDRVEQVLSDLSEIDEPIIVVDDGSTDDTAVKAIKHEVTVLRHRVNLGKGAALRTGARYARDQGSEHIIFMDGDGQHTASMIEDLRKELKTHPFVIGCRSFEEMPLFSWLGNHLFYYTARILFGVTVQDTQSGFRGLHASVLEDVMWTSNDYAVETEMLVEAARHGINVSTIPIRTIYHDETKGTDPLHGVGIILSMAYWWITRWF